MPAIASQPSAQPSAPSAPSAFRINRRFLVYLAPRWRRVAAIYLVMLLGTGTFTAIPLLVRWIVDHGIAEQDPGVVWRAVGILMLLALLRAVLAFLMGRWSEMVSQGVAATLRQEMFTRFTAMSVSLISSMESGQLLQRAVQDVERIRFLTGRAVLRVVDAAVLFLATLAVLLGINPLLGVLALATMPLLVYRGYQYGRRQRPLASRLQQQLGTLTSLLEQNLRGSRIVKAFAQEDAEIRRFEEKNRDWFALARKQVIVQTQHIPLLDFIASLSTVAIIWLGGRLVIENTLTIGELVAFTTYLGQLISPVRRLGVIIPAVAMASAAGERIFTIIDAKSEVSDAPDARPLPPIEGQVRFEDVSFSYFNQRTVLNKLNFQAEPGEVVALLGATGSGKSTIINLIPRFYDVTGGRIQVDGYDVRGVRLNSLRGQIGMVLQETILFAASIRENIAFGVDEATETEVIEAAKAAQAHDFIMAMPDGYETRVGERGATLSGGQKQRVAIARALLKNPRILLLDDATSSVDAETERLIQQALERLMEGRTSFIIAQRLSTVRMADKVLVLQDGRVAASGTHEELLRESGLYAEIYHRHLR